MMDDRSLATTLDLACQAAGLEYDGALVERMEHQARRTHPGPRSESWAEQLAQIVKPLGFRAVQSQASLLEIARVVSPDRPIIVWVPDADSTDAASTAVDSGSWLLLLDMKGRKFRVSRAGDRTQDLSPKDFAKRLGLSSQDEPARWVLLEPIAPCADVHRSQHQEHAENFDHDHGDVGQHAPVSPVRRLLGLMKPERHDIRVVIAYSAAVGILSLASPLAIEALVGTVALNQLAQQLLIISLVLLVCLAMAAALRALQTFVVELIQRRLFVRVAADLAYRLPRVRIDAFDRQNGPELVNRFFDILTVQKVAALILLDGIAIVIQAAFGLIVLALYSPYLVGFDLVILFTVAFIVLFLGRGAVRTSIRESRAKYDVAGCLEEMARAPLAYKMGNGPDYAIHRADRLSRAYLTARTEHFSILMRQIVFALGFQALATAAMLGLGGWLVINETLTLGQLVAAELIVATVVGSFAKLGKHLEYWYDLMAAMEKLGHLIDLPLERGTGEDPAFTRAGTAVGCHQLSYHYGNHHAVLHDLNLEIKSGERVAIVGPSGSGKSTLGDLLYGLREPTQGHVTLDGLNLRDLDLEAVRNEVSIVKGVDVIDDSILENVRMGRSYLSLKSIYDALEAVALADEVAELPNGLHTRLSSSGGPLSLGQSRRLMLARVLAGQPNLVVLDEALDGIDLDSRASVLDAFFNSPSHWTLVVITHSQEVAERCDRAIAILHGRAEHGLAMDNGHSRTLEDWLKEVGK